ncbi:MAG: hypothetical protein ACRDWB_02865 [Acidimicrobiales bacterium]
MAKFTSLIRSHRLLAGAGVAAIALGGGIGLGLAISDSGGSATPVAGPTPIAPTTPATTPKNQSQPKVQGVRGQITAENGSTWTVMSRAGKSVTVDISSSTQFGTKSQPASASQFEPGSQIAAIGTRAGTTVTATRVFAPVAANPPGGTTPNSSSPTTVAPPTGSA